MATVANQFLTLEVLSGAGAPQAGIYNAGPPSFLPTLILGNPFPAPAVGENQALVTSYRAYDRVVKIGVPGVGNTIYSYHNDRIFGFTAPPNWSLLHSITGQSSSLNFGLHTGLYVVDAEGGAVSYLVGLFVAQAGGLGYVKLNLTTGVWSDGIDSTLTGTAMSTCVAYNGRLAHANQGQLTLFDPANNTFSQADYGTQFGGSTGFAKVRVVSGRLFVMDVGSGGFCKVGESLFGGIAVQHTAATQQVTGSETWTMYITKAIFLMYEQRPTEPGGQGMRVFQWGSVSSTPGDPLGAPNDAGALVDAASAPALGQNQASEWVFGSDNGHTATAGGVASSLGFFYNIDSTNTIFTSVQGIESVGNTPWVRRVAAPQPLATWSRIGSQTGCSEVLAPNSFAQIESFEAFSDGTVSRGILIKFRMFTAGGSFPQLRFLYGLELNPIGGVKATLSVGDGVAIGGSMTLDAPNKQINTANPVESGATLYQIIWDLGADSIPDDEWVLIRSVGFTSGFETAGLLNPGPAQSVLSTLGDISGNPPETGGPVREITTVTSGNPTVTGGPVREITTVTSGNPTVTGGSVREIPPAGTYPPNINARVPARAHSQPGWVNFQVDGAAQGGDQQNANLLDSVSTPAVPSGSQSGAPVDGDVKAVASFELGAFDQVGNVALEGGIDLVAGGDTVVATVPTGFEWVIFGASVRCEAANAITTPATARIGFDGPASNLFSPQLLVALTTQDDAYDYPVGGESVIAPAGSAILFRVDAGATGTSQTGEVTLFGYARRI